MNLSVGRTATKEIYSQPAEWYLQFEKLLQSPEVKMVPAMNHVLKGFIGNVFMVQFNPGEPSQTALDVYGDLVEDDLEFVEIYNPTAGVVNLTEWFQPFSALR